MANQAISQTQTRNKNVQFNGRTRSRALSESGQLYVSSLDSLTLPSRVLFCALVSIHIPCAFPCLRLCLHLSSTFCALLYAYLFWYIKQDSCTGCRGVIERIFIHTRDVMGGIKAELKIVIKSKVCDNAQTLKKVYKKF